MRIALIRVEQQLGHFVDFLRVRHSSPFCVTVSANKGFSGTKAETQSSHLTNSLKTAHTPSST